MKRIFFSLILICGLSFAGRAQNDPQSFHPLDPTTAEPNPTEDYSSALSLSPTVDMGFVDTDQMQKNSPDVERDYKLFSLFKNSDASILKDVYGMQMIENVSSSENNPATAGTIQSFMKDWKVLAIQNDRKNEEANEQLEDTYAKLAAEMKSNQEKLKDPKLKVADIAKIMAAGRRSCEAFLKSQESARNLRLEKTLSFCEMQGNTGASLKCLEQPFTILKLISESDSDARKAVFHTGFDLTTDIEKKLRTLLSNRDARDEIRSDYEDISRTPRNIATSENLQDKLTFLNLASSAEWNSSLHYFIAPFNSLAEATKEREDKSGVFSNIGRMQVDLANEFEKVSEEYPDARDIQRKILSTFFSFQSCVHKRLPASASWSMDSEADRMVSKWQRKQTQTCSDYSSPVQAAQTSSAQLLNIATARAAANGLTVSGIIFPEEYIREREENGSPMSAKDVDKLMLFSAVHGLPAAYTDGSEIPLNDPDFFAKVHRLAQIALSEGLANDETLSTKYPHREDSIVDNMSSDQEREIFREMNLYSKAEATFIHAKMSEINRDYPPDDIIPHSSFITQKLSMSPDGNNVVTVKYDLPGVEPRQTRDIIVTYDGEHTMLQAFYFVNGKLAALPPELKNQINKH